MDIIRQIFDAGVVGCGGAGFPTHIKLKNTVEYLIVNGAECEPLIETDKYIMRTKSSEIITAMELVGRQVKAEHIILGLKRKYNKEIECLQNAIINLNSKVKFHFMENFYPAGDEQVLVYEITGRSIPAGGIPLDAGVLVSNAGTMFNIYEASLNKPFTDKYISVSGEVKHPCIIKVPIGISVDECIKAAGGSRINDYCAILGGPMMGRIIDCGQVKDEAVTKTLGSIILLPREHYIVKRSKTPIDRIINRIKTSCIQCTFCTELCPRYLIGHKIRPHKIMRSIGFNDNNDDVLKEALICCECGVCELYACPMGLSPRIMNVNIKNRLRKQGVSYKKEKEMSQVDSMRSYRKIPVPRLISRIDLNKYANQHLEGEKDVKTDKVTIMLKQHAGKPAVPVVSVGEKVAVGQLIAHVKYEDIGANVHSSINGEVIGIRDDKIVIYDKKLETVL